MKQQQKRNGITYWLDVPSTTPRGVVILTHGYSEHAGRYSDLIQMLVNETSWAVLSYDVRGHGQSEGPRGYVEHFSMYLKDLEMLQGIAETEIVKNRQIPLVFFGHSNGGLITLRYLVEVFGSPELRRSRGRNIKACILCAPFIRTHNQLSLAERFLVWLVNKVNPTYQNPFDPGFEEFLSHDVDYCKTRSIDERCFRHSTVGWLAQCQIAQKEIKQRIGNLKDLPTYWFLAGEDMVVHTPTAKRLAVKLHELGSKENPPVKHAWEEYPNFYHEIFQEKGKEKPIAALQTFLSKL